MCPEIIVPPFFKKQWYYLHKYEKSCNFASSLYIENTQHLINKTDMPSSKIIKHINSTDCEHACSQSFSVLISDVQDIIEKTILLAGVTL